MVKDRYSPTERIGINAVEGIVIKDLGWIFREQPIVDMGIDAHIEIAERGDPTGRILAVQVKTGRGNFHETDDAYVYYGDETHLEYWAKHSLPVVLVGHLPETKETVWAVINEDTIEHTKKGWKVSLPKKRPLGEESEEDLNKASFGTAREQKLRELTIHEPLMRHVRDGLKVSVELEDWVNKSLSRSNVRIFIHDKNGNETSEKPWMIWWTGYSIEEIVERLFPFFDAEIDEEFYEENEEIEEEEPSLAGNDDDDDEQEFEPGAFDGEDDFRPYVHALGGEVDLYRLKLNLNELGEAYLVVADYLDED